MPPARIIAAFFAWLVLLYALLVIPWPGLRSAYATGYRAVANKLFRNFGAYGAVRFRPLLHGQEKADSEIDIANRQTRVTRTAQHSTTLTGYLPTAEVLALILATPIPWRRKWKALLAGLVLIHVLILLRVLVALLFGFSADGAVALFHPGPLARSALTMLFNVVAVGISFTYVAPIFLWIAVAIRPHERQAAGPESGRQSHR